MLYLSETTEQSPTDAKLTKKKTKIFYRCLRFGILAITVLKRAKKKKTNKQTNPKTEKTTRF